MAKDVFVTDNLHRISDHIAESSKKGADLPVSGPEGPGSAEESNPTLRRDRMSPETERALKERHDEFVRFRRDLMSRLTESSAGAGMMSVRLRNSLDEYSRAENAFSEALKKVEALTEPDVDSVDYQVRLAEVCRQLEMIRLEMIALKSKLDSPVSSPPQNQMKTELNLFSEMASLSFSQLLRIGFGIGLPLVLSILVAGGLIAGMMILTFRFGL